MTVSTPLECNEIIHSSSNRRRWTPLEKQQIVHETYHSGATVSYVARKHGIPPSQLFYWRKLMESSALTGVKTENLWYPKVKRMNSKGELSNLNKY